MARARRFLRGDEGVSDSAAGSKLRSSSEVRMGVLQSLRQRVEQVPLVGEPLERPDRLEDLAVP